MAMYASVGRREYAVESFEQVSLAYLDALQAARERGLTGHPPRCEIRANGKVIAHVTGNGIVYPGLVMRLDAVPLYVPKRS